MTTIAAILGFTSGFALMRYHESTAGMIATSLIVDAALAPVTAVIASRRGRSTTLWALLGFAFGMWALAFVLVFKPRAANPPDPAAPDYPPASDAA
ncbi:MAG: hypothetical protein ACREQN_11715 [Candidatus Binataceae bacterium]